MKTITIKKITLEKLEKYLKKIGWSVSGNSLNKNIRNDYGEATLFYIEYGERLEIRRYPFGRNYSGSFTLSFKDMWMQYYEAENIENTFLSLIFPRGNTTKGCKSFISFYPTKMRDEIKKSLEETREK